MKILTVLTLIGLGAFVSGKKLTVQQEKGFLEALGLNAAPHLSGQPPVYIPDSIKELYSQQTGQEVDTTCFRLPGHHVGASNTARTFISRQVGGCGGASHNCILGFEINPTVYEAETMESAQLKVYWKPNLSVKRNAGSFRTDVYDVLKLKQPHIKVVVDTKKMHHRDAEKDEGWYLFDVTPAVQRWISEAKKPAQQLVVIERGKMRVKTKASRVVELLPEGVFSDAYLVVYSEDERHRHLRLKRSASSRRNRSRKKSKRRKGHWTNCKRHSLYVDFTEVGWNDWIVAPPGYDAHFCDGECPFPLAEHLNATNHAIVQTLVNSVNPAAVPRSCCVPTELSPISMLYLDEYEKVVLKNYENMVVEGCGCR